jgi:5-(carboxyamino)imidazole ribonucleotide mutase
MRMDARVSGYEITGSRAGVPVGTFAIGKAGSVNAALQAAAILALNDAALAQRLAGWRQAQTDAVALAPSDDLT